MTSKSSQDGDFSVESVELTPAQWKVLMRVNSGLLNKQIAFDLGIAEATVKAHMTAVMRKLNVHNRTQAAIVAHVVSRGGQTALNALRCLDHRDPDREGRALSQSTLDIRSSRPWLAPSDGRSTGQDRRRQTGAPWRRRPD